MPEPSIHYECDLFEWAERNARNQNPADVFEYPDDPLMPGLLEMIELMNVRWKPVQDESYEINKVNQRAAQARRRRRMHEAKGTFGRADVEELHDQQQGRCGYCGIPFFGDYEVDHMVPIAKGGSNEISNILLACTSCNRSKKDKLLHEWQVWRGW